MMYFIKHNGFGITPLIFTMKGMVEILEKRSTERFNLLSRVFREKSIPRFIRAYYRYNPHMHGDAETFLANMPKGISYNEVRQLVIGHADLLLSKLMTFSIEDVALQSGLSSETTKLVLDALSLPVGGLQGKNPEHLFMDNPVWYSPIVRTQNGYFCPIPQSTLSYIHGIVRSMSNTVELRDALKTRRSGYLEQKVGLLLSNALPSAKLRHGVKWRVGPVEYETDHIVLIDKTIVIVEDKSAALTAPGLRGAPDRIRNHIRDLIVDPTEQSARLEEIIWQAKAGDISAANALTPFGFDFANIDRIIRVSVTLDDFSVLSSAEEDLKKAGWIPPQVALAPAVGLADLEIVLDILEVQSFILHYLGERRELQKASGILGDEIDFLGCYLQTGFNFGDLDKTKIAIILTGMSSPIDHYYLSRDAGVRLKKPKPDVGSYLLALINAIESRAAPGWSTITVDILRCLSFGEHKEIETRLDRLKKSVDQNWRKPGHECLLVVNSTGPRDTAIAFYAYPRQLAARRKSNAENLTARALELSNRKRCVMICRSTAQWDQPYQSICVATASTLCDAGPPDAASTRLSNP